MTAPARVGAYPIERELGRGGMGIVYLGRDTRLGRLVAIKVLPDAFAGDPERLTRFEREAMLLASLNHPNIAGIYGLEETNGRRFLALEYVEGPTLAQRLERGSLPIDEALDVGQQIAAALEAAHESGVIHRDLKPGNVKLTPAGDVKVLDFGLAKGTGTAESGVDMSQSPTIGYAPTGMGVILGTAAYMSPEQARGRTLDRRTDIWSFGCVLYECLTGRQLFSGETVSDTIAKILEREPDWSAIPAAVPEKIRDLLRRCLEKDARKRLRDVGDARIELEEALAARTSKSRVAAAEVELGRRSIRARIPTLAYVVALVALAAAVLAMFALRPPRLPTVRLSVLQPEGESFSFGAEDYAIAPNGRTLAFVAADSSGTPRLWTRSLEGLMGRPIPGTDNASKPFWSPDSRAIDFFAEGKLKRVRPGGGVQAICDAPNARGGSWGAKDVIVFAPTGQSPLFAVSSSGGAPRQVTTLDSTRHETGHRYPWFLPDGNHFLYVTLPATPDGYQVMVGSLDGRRSRALMLADSSPTYAAPGYLFFLRGLNLAAQRFDAGLLRLVGEPTTLPDIPGSSTSSGFRAVTASTNGVLAYLNGGAVNRRLLWFDRSGRELGAVPVPPAQYELGALSPDERTVAIGRRTSPDQADVWLVDLARGVGTRFTYGPRQNLAPVWSPDGSRIAFESNRNGPWDVYTKPSSGANPEVPFLKSPAQFKHPSTWSPDGRFLIVSQMEPNTGFDVWIFPADGSGPGAPYLETPYDERVPAISPNGRWMLYTSDESGRPELYVQSFPTPGHKYQISTTGCFVGTWRKDGKEIFLVGGADFQTMTSAIVEENGNSFRTGSPHFLFRAPPNSFGVATTGDGQRFLFSVPENEGTPLSVTVLLNWMAALAGSSSDHP
jgi:eukaryotic-like serine/threonine-protein kinase